MTKTGRRIVRARNITFRISRVRYRECKAGQRHDNGLPIT